MTDSIRTKRSEYMEWAKLHSEGRFNLATSGVTSVPLNEFPVEIDELEITGPGGYGYGPLQQKIADYAGVAKECVVAAAGTSMANYLAMTAVLDPGDEVLIEQPTYGPLLDVARYIGAQVRRIPRAFDSGFDIVPGEVERAVTSKTRLIVLSNLHNPSGAQIPIETLRSIGEIAQRSGGHILVDEVYLEMLFQGREASSFTVGETLGAAENPFLVTSSLTKAYGLSGLRCGWILAAPKLAHRIWLLNDLFGVNQPHLAERMSVIAFEHLDHCRIRTQERLACNRALLDTFLGSRSDLECFSPPAGTVAFPLLKQGNVERLLQLLREKYETTVVPGRFFEMPQHFRIGIGGETATLREGLQRLGAALDEIAR